MRSRIAGHQSSVILDGAMFEAAHERPIGLRPTAPVHFLRLPPDPRFRRRY